MMGKQKSVIWEWIEAIGIAIILALLIRTFLMEPFYIPSGSMEPTLQVGDKIIVNKLGNRFSDPKRGQVVVFRYPLDQSQDFIKRVVGLPGEMVEVRDSRVYIDGQILTEDYLPVGILYPDYGPITVPGDSYFVLGDNRSNSQDSRTWGFLSRKLVVGKAVVIFWPINRIGAIG